MPFMRPTLTQLRKPVTQQCNCQTGRYRPSSLLHVLVKFGAVLVSLPPPFL